MIHWLLSWLLASPGRKQWGGQKARVGLMASAEREPITEVWRQSPQRDPGAEPLVRGSGGEAPLKLKAFCRWTTQTRVKICHFSLVILNPQVSHKQCLEWIELVNFLINVKRICVTSNINMKSTVEADGVGSGLYKQYGKTIDSRPLQEVH